MELDLTKLREEINETDEEIVRLFKKRMAIASGVAEYKREHGLPVLDAARERALLEKISVLAGEEMDGYARTLYRTMLDVSRAYQYTKLHQGALTYDEIAKSLEITPPIFPSRAKVACQGVEGAYSQLAAEKLFRFPTITYFSNFNAVFSAIEAKMCKYGILPIENSTAGSVKQVYDLMKKHKFNIVRSVRIKVDHNLLAKPGTKLSDIKEIFSHEQAIQQSSKFLASLPQDVKITCVENTAKAAMIVALSERSDVASISSSFCAEQYNLEVVASSIQDNGNNQTRFICISNDLEIFPGADKTSLMLVTPHKPGALYKIISRFNSLGINLLKLESRPIPDRNFEFMFYFDIEVSVYSERFAQLLAEIEQVCDDFTYLGTYSEVV